MAEGDSTTQLCVVDPQRDPDGLIPPTNMVHHKR